jgi:transposase
MKKYPPEFKIQAASLVLDSGYSIQDAAKSSNVSLSAIRSWVKQLKFEREGVTPQNSSAITAQQQHIQALEKRIKKLELEKEILKKASALLISDNYQSTH